MACRDWAAKVGGGVLGRVWALVAALALLIGLIAMAPAPAQAASFRDVPSGQWYTSWVDQASDQGLMSGFTDPATGRPTGYFGPDEPLTRAQVATVLWRMAGGPSSGHASFPDVERGSWYDAPVAWCVKAGVVTGYTSGPDKGLFRPDRPVTRQELATMVWRYAKHAGMDVADPDPTAFESTTDWRTVDSWASEALTWTAAAGVLSGVDNHDGTYSVVPFDTATRAMAAKVFVVLSGSPSVAKASYTAAFDSNGGSAVKAQAVRSGAKASKPADPTKSGYLFKGWYSDKSLTKAFNFNSAVRSNLTLYAKWEAKAAYTVTFNANGGTAVKAQSVSSGAKASKPANPTKAGHVFKGWYSDKSLTKAYDFNSAVKSDLALYAKWEANEYTVTFVSNGGTSVAKQTVAYGAKVSKPSDPTLDDSQFVGWYTDTACTEAYDFNLPVKANLTLYAKWDSLDVWAILYTDGTLSIQRGSRTIPGKTVSDKWTGFDDDTYKDVRQRPWDARSGKVKRVITSGGVAPVSTAWWFAYFTRCDSFDLSGLDLSNVTNADMMFVGCSSVKSLDLTCEAGPTSLRNAEGMLWGCTTLESVRFSGWNTSNAVVTDMFKNDLALDTLVFSECKLSTVKAVSHAIEDPSQLKNLDVAGVDVTNETGLFGVFSNLAGLTSLDLSSWDVSNVKSFGYLFSGCSSLESVDLSGWDTTSALVFESMFSGCSALQSLNLSGWDVTTVNSFAGMFMGCSSLQSLNLSGWDMASASHYEDMFSKCSSLKSLNLSNSDIKTVRLVLASCSSLTNLDVSDMDLLGATSLSGLFKDMSSLQSINVSGWDVSSVTDLSGVFNGCKSLESLNLSGWDVSGASGLSGMFSRCSSLTSLGVSGWDVSGASNLRGMFSNCSSLTSLDLSGWDVSGASDLSWMFNRCSSLTSLDLSGWDISGGSDLHNMFFDCSRLQSLDVSGWDFSGASRLDAMFWGCSSLTSLDVSGWDVSGASNLSGMFFACSSLTSLDVSGWDVSGASSLSSMFLGCSSLTSLDVSGWDVSGTSSLTGMFSQCYSLTSLDLSGWDVSNASSLSDMFYKCSFLGTVTLGVGCGPLVGELPYGPWYDAEGKEYDRPPVGVAGTFTKAKPAMLALAVDGVPDVGASLPAQIVEGEQDGLRYVVVPESASFECGFEYPELAGRYVGPGVYVMGYVGEADSVTVPLEIDGAPVVSANLSWNDSDRAGMTRLATVTFEHVEGKASSLAQLDVSGNSISSLGIEGLDVLARLNCEGNPIADLAVLQAWAAQDGHEAKLPQVQDVTPVEPGDVAAPSESQEPASPDVPTKPAEPANPEAPSTEPSDPAVPSEPEQPGSSDVSGEPDQPGDDSVGSDMGESDEQEEPADTAELGEAGQDSDARATEEQAGAVELAEPGEEPLALAA